MSGCILHRFISHSPVFLVNSCLDLFSAPHSREDPLSRSYRVSLPSSLTMSLPSALVCSTRLRVSVCGTGAAAMCLADFLGSMVTLAVAQPGGLAYFQGRIGGWTCLPPSAPTLFNGLFRQAAEVSLLRLRIARCASNVILNVSSIGLAVRLILRTRLTLNRLALFRKP